jgi:hypothetical protein
MDDLDNEGHEPPPTRGFHRTFHVERIHPHYVPEGYVDPDSPQDDVEEADEVEHRGLRPTRQEAVLGVLAAIVCLAMVITILVVVGTR